MPTHLHSPRSISPRWTRSPCSCPPVPPLVPPLRPFPFPIRWYCWSPLPLTSPSPSRCPPGSTTSLAPSLPPSLWPPCTGPEAVASQYNVRPCSACLLLTSVCLSVPPPACPPLGTGSNTLCSSLSAPASRWAASPPRAETHSTPAPSLEWPPTSQPQTAALAAPPP